MRDSHFVMRRTSALAAALLVTASAWAANFAVSPIRIVLSAGHASDILTVRNEGDGPLLMQAQTVAWTQEDNQDKYTPTRDILVSPPIFTLAPNASQVVRIGLRREPQPGRELSYRVFLQEVPPEAQPEEMRIRMALRVGVPVFVTPGGPVNHALAWKGRRLREGPIEVSVTNRGQAHIQLWDFSVRRPDGGEATQVNLPMAYVLPGQERTFLLDVKALASLSVGRVHLRMESDAGPIDADVDLLAP